AAAAAREEALRELRSLLEPHTVEPPVSDPAPTLPIERPALETPNTVRADGAASHLARQLRDMIRDGAQWEALRPPFEALLRCMDSPDEMQANSELLLGVYVALRGRAGELRIHLAALPPDHEMQQDEELAAEYQASFAEPAAPEPG